MQSKEQFSREEIIRRYLQLSQSILPQPDMEIVYKALHEMQQLYLMMLGPLFVPIDNLDLTIVRDTQSSSMSLRDFLNQTLERVLRSQSRGLSFSEATEAYHYVGLNASPSKEVAPLAFNLHDKRTFLLTLQVLNAVVIKHAASTLAVELRESGDRSFQKVSQHILSNHDYRVPIFQVRLDEKLQEDAIDTVHGAANDGITHLAAVIDLLWDDYVNASISDLFKEARRVVVKPMTQYPSWQVQILDMMILAERNPYQLSSDGSLEENAMCRKFQNYVNRLHETTIRWDSSSILGILTKSLNILEIDNRLRESTMLVAETALSLATDDETMRIAEFGGLVSPVVLKEKRENLMQSPDRKLRRAVERMNDFTFMRATALAQAPGKIHALLAERRNADPQHEPRCALLNVPGGFVNWLQALSDSLEIIMNSP